MSKRSIHPVAPAVLLGMVVLVSLQTVAVGTAGGCVLGQPSGMLRSDADRRAVATWIASLGDAARALQALTGAGVGQAVLLSPARTAAAATAAPTMPMSPEHGVRPPLPMLATHLNLPPPALPAA